jgi:hypothetical protein
MGWQTIYVPFLFAGNTIIDQDGIFVYNGTPTTNNLELSVAATAGTDSFGNAYLSGEFSYFEGISQWTAMGIQPLAGQAAQLAWYYTTGLTETGWILGGSLAATAGVASPTGSPLQYNANGQGLLIGAANPEPVELNGYISYGGLTAPAAHTGFANTYADANSNLKFVSGIDGNAYSTGKYVSRVGGAILINSLSNILITSIAVAANVPYEFEAQVLYVENQAAGAAIIGFGGTSVISQVTGNSYFMRTAVEGIRNWNGTLTTDQSLTMTGITMSFTTKGEIVFSSAGTFTIFGTCTVAADTWTVAKGSWLKISPITAD